MVDNNLKAITVMTRRLGTGGVGYLDEALQPLDTERLV